VTHKRFFGCLNSCTTTKGYSKVTSLLVLNLKKIKGLSIKDICTNLQKIDPFPLVRKMPVLAQPPSLLVRAGTPKILKNLKLLGPKGADVHI